MISIVTPVFNEAAGIEGCVERVRSAMAQVDPKIRYEHIFVDNDSSDDTLKILAAAKRSDCHIRVFRNARNIGVHASFQRVVIEAKCNVVIPILARGQIPSDLVPRLIGASAGLTQSVLAVREETRRTRIRIAANAVLYALLSKFGTPPIPRNFIGAGLFLGPQLEAFKESSSPEPFLRGIVLRPADNLPVISYKEESSYVGRSTVRSNLSFFQYGFLEHTSLLKFVGTACCASSLLSWLFLTLSAIAWRAGFPTALELVMFGQLSLVTFAVGTVALASSLSIERRLKQEHLVDCRELINDDQT